MDQQPTLVTGGAGYVGSILVAGLLASGRRVRALDSLLHGSVPSLLGAFGDDRFEFVAGDVRDAATVGRAVEGARDVVHLAAIVGDPACSRDPEAARAVNVDATVALLDAAEAAGVRRYLFASTCSNYGKLDDPSLAATEEWELRPLSAYAETKVGAELEVLARNRDGFETACLRLATVYGTSPRMRFDLTVNEFARDVLLDGEVVVYGEQFWRPYVHVRDAAAAFELALAAPSAAVAGEVFNVGSTSENYRKLDIVELLQERLPSARATYVHRAEDPRDYRVSFDKIERVLGFACRHTVPDGIDEVLGLLRSGLLADPKAPVYRN
ncbi:MAG TPA: NAD-dependent epimerase/dehydratase family protein [Gaiellaceae bacterium]|nr:NAD-dependent epimerase/dehydratase family protein [Gaiellaceae bacterium]